MYNKGIKSLECEMLRKGECSFSPFPFTASIVYERGNHHEYWLN